MRAIPQGSSFETYDLTGRAHARSRSGASRAYDASPVNRGAR